VTDQSQREKPALLEKAKTALQADPQTKPPILHPAERGDEVGLSNSDIVALSFTITRRPSVKLSEGPAALAAWKDTSEGHHNVIPVLHPLAARDARALDILTGLHNQLPPPRRPRLLADADAKKEDQVTKSVLPVIEGKIRDAKCVSGKIPFRNLSHLTDGTLVSGILTYASALVSCSWTISIL
jgi:hypothetical protein